MTTTQVGPIEVEATNTSIALYVVGKVTGRRRLITDAIPGTYTSGKKAKRLVDYCHNRGLGTYWAELILKDGTRFNPAFEVFLNKG